MVFVQLVLVFLGGIDGGLDPFAARRLNLRVPIERHRDLVFSNWLKSRLGASSLEIDVFFKANDLQPQLFKAFELDYRKNEFFSFLLLRKALLFQIFLELTHVIGTNTENVQGFQWADESRCPNPAF